MAVYKFRENNDWYVIDFVQPNRIEGIVSIVVYRLAANGELPPNNEPLCERFLTGRRNWDYILRRGNNLRTIDGESSWENFINRFNQNDIIVNPLARNISVLRGQREIFSFNNIRENE